MDNNISKVNDYMKLTQGLVSMTDKSGLHSLGELAKILKGRNKKYHYPHQEENEELLQLHSKLKKEQYLSAPIISSKQEQYALKYVSRKFEYEELTVNNQDSYLQKHLEYKIFELIRKSMMSKERSMKRKQLQKIKGYHVEPEVKQSTGEQINDEKIFQKCIKDCIDWKDMDILHERVQNNSREWWIILSEQVKQFKYKGGKSLALLIVSLRLLEERFSNELPVQECQINEFVRKNYVEANQKYYIDRFGNYKWGIAYAYLRAGNLSQFYLTLSQLGSAGLYLRAAYMEYHDSLKSYVPKKLQILADSIDDPFYRQIIHIVKGEPLFTSSKLCSIHTYNLIWLLIKTFGIHKLAEGRAEEYWEFCDQVAESYKQEREESKISHYSSLVYLGRYSAIPLLHHEKKYGQRMPDIEYVHFLISLCSHPSMLDSTSSLRKQLTRQLLSYSKKLLKNHNQYYKYYLVVIPEEQYAECLPQIVDSLDIFDFIRKSNGWNFQEEMMDSYGRVDLYIRGYKNVILGLVQRAIDLSDVKFLAEECQTALDDKFWWMVIWKGLCLYLKKQHRNKPANSLVSDEEFKLLNMMKTEGSLPQPYNEGVKFLEKYLSMLKHLQSSITGNIKALKKQMEDDEYMGSFSQLESENSEIYQVCLALEGVNALVLIFDYARKFLRASQLVGRATGNFQLSEQWRKKIGQGIQMVKTRENTNHSEYLEEFMRDHSIS